MKVGCYNKQIYQSALQFLALIINLVCLFFLQPTISGEIQSPLGPATVEFIDPREPVAVSISIPYIMLYYKHFLLCV